MEKCVKTLASAATYFSPLFDGPGSRRKKTILFFFDTLKWFR